MPLLIYYFNKFNFLEKSISDADITISDDDNAVTKIYCIPRYFIIRKKVLAIVFLSLAMVSDSR